MATPNERRARRKAKQALNDDETLYQFQNVRDRCGAGVWQQAWDQLKGTDVKFEEFASTRWRCPQCPNLMACTLDNNVQAA